MALIFRLSLLMAIIAMCLARVANRQGWRRGAKPILAKLGSQENGRGKGRESLVAEIKAKCRDDPSSCRPSAAARARARQHREGLEQLLTRLGRKNAKEAMDLTFMIKQQALENAGLAGIVEPMDDGVYDGDMLLSAEQAMSILNQHRGGRRHKRGLAITESGLKWPTMTIFYKFDPLSLFTAEEKEIFHRSAKKIENAVPCLSLTENQFASEYVITISRNNSFCGLASLGYQRDDGNYMDVGNYCLHNYPESTVLHEFMHNLGFSHEHRRNDSNKFITFASNTGCSNVFHTDSFSILTTYDIKSVTHYDVTQCAATAKDPAMQGQIAIAQTEGRLSDFDVKSLETLYYCHRQRTPNGCPNYEVVYNRWVEPEASFTAISPYHLSDTISDCTKHCEDNPDCMMAEWYKYPKDSDSPPRCVLYPSSNWRLHEDTGSVVIKCR